MNTLRVMLGFSLMGLVMVGCGHKKQVYADDPAATSTKGMVASVEWLKNKGKTIDMKVTLTNNNSFPVHFGKASLNLDFNGQPGSLKDDDLNLTIDAGGNNSRTYSFRFEKKLEKRGKAVFSVDPIFKGDSAAGTKTKVAGIKRELPVKAIRN